MISDQTTSQGRHVLENQAEHKIGGRAEASPDKDGPVTLNVPSILVEESLRLIRRLADDKPKPVIRRLLSHPLATVIVGFILSVPIGAYLTTHYAIKQQETARQQSFSDELNKIRIQKIGEVWEQIDKNEAELDYILDRANKSPGSDKKDVDGILKLVEEDVAIVNKNRFWLGEQTYGRIKNYLDIEGRYALDKLLGQPGIDLSDTIKKREQAKQDILQIRSALLKGEPIL